MFASTFQSLTLDYGCMVLVNKSNSDKLEDNCFWYIAPDLTTNRDTIGCKQYNQYHENNYDPNWNDKHKLFDANAFYRKKKK